jgi:hypothetical protein
LGYALYVIEREFLVWHEIVLLLCGEPSSFELIHIGSFCGIVLVIIPVIVAFIYNICEITPGRDGLNDSVICLPLAPVVV